MRAGEIGLKRRRVRAAVEPGAGRRAAIEPSPDGSARLEQERAGQDPREQARGGAGERRGRGPGSDGGGDGMDPELRRGRRWVVGAQSWKVRSRASSSSSSSPLLPARASLMSLDPAQNSSKSTCEDRGEDGPMIMARWGWGEGGGGGAPPPPYPPGI